MTRLLSFLRRKPKPVMLGRFFHQSVAAFNNGTKQYFNDSAALNARPSRRAGDTSDGSRSGAVA